MALSSATKSMSLPISQIYNTLMSRNILIVNDRNPTHDLINTNLPSSFQLCNPFLTLGDCITQLSSY